MGLERWPGRVPAHRDRACHGWGRPASPRSAATPPRAWWTTGMVARD